MTKRSPRIKSFTSVTVSRLRSLVRGNSVLLWKQKDLSSSLGSAKNILGDLGQITFFVKCWIRLGQIFKVCYSVVRCYESEGKTTNFLQFSKPPPNARYVWGRTPNFRHSLTRVLTDLQKAKVLSLKKRFLSLGCSYSPECQGLTAVNIKMKTYLSWTGEATTKVPTMPVSPPPPSPAPAPGLLPAGTCSPSPRLAAARKPSRNTFFPLVGGETAISNSSPTPTD